MTGGHTDDDVLLGNAFLSIPNVSEGGVGVILQLACPGHQFVLAAFESVEPLVVQHMG